MKKTFLGLISASLLTAGGLAFSSCSDTKSYAEMLNDEKMAINYYLSNYKVENQIPADSVFEIGEDAPYYRIEPEGNLYMQVLDAGDLSDKANKDDLIYFRFMRLNLLDEWDLGLGSGRWEGNADDMAMSPTSFRFENFSVSSSSQYGVGLQYPLYFLGMGCKVNLIVKSQYGLTEELAYVTPFLYNVRYFRPQT